MGHESADQPDGAAEQNDELHHVRPDHRREPSQHGIRDRQQPHQGDGQREGHPRGDSHGLGWCIDHDAQPAEATENEQRRDGSPRALAIAQEDVFIACCDTMLAIDRIEQSAQDRRGDQAHRDAEDHGDVMTVGEGGNPHVRRRAGQRGEHAHAHGQPGHVPSGQEVVLRGLLPAGQQQPNRDHPREIGHEYDGVCDPEFVQHVAKVQYRVCNTTYFQVCHNSVRSATFLDVMTGDTVFSWGRIIIRPYSPLI